MEMKDLHQGTGVYYVDFDYSVPEEERPVLNYRAIFEKILNGVDVVVRAVNYDPGTPILLLRAVLVENTQITFAPCGNLADVVVSITEDGHIYG